MHSVRSGGIEVHFAEGGSLIAFGGKEVGEGGFVFGERGFEGCDSCGVGIEAGEDGLTGGSADGGIAVVGGEAGALGSEAVEIGCLGKFVALGAEDIAGVIVGDQE